MTKQIEFFVNPRVEQEDNGLWSAYFDALRADQNRSYAESQRGTSSLGGGASTAWTTGGGTKRYRAPLADHRDGRDEDHRMTTAKQNALTDVSDDGGVI